MRRYPTSWNACAQKSLFPEVNEANSHAKLRFSRQLLRNIRTEWPTVRPAATNKKDGAAERLRTRSFKGGLSSQFIINSYLLTYLFKLTKVSPRLRYVVILICDLSFRSSLRVSRLSLFLILIIERTFGIFSYRWIRNLLLSLRWKNFENRSACGKVRGKSIVALFSGNGV